MSDKHTIVSKSEFFEIEPKTDYVTLAGGKRMKIRELSSDQRIEFAQDNSDQSGRMRISDKSKESIAKLIIWGAISEDGVPLFDDTDRDALRAAAGGPVDTVATAILVLSGIRSGQVEDAAKN